MSYTVSQTLTSITSRHFTMHISHIKHLTHHHHLSNITTRTDSTSPFITQLYDHKDMQIYSERKTEKWTVRTGTSQLRNYDTLRWFGDVKCKDPVDWIKLCTVMGADGTRQANWSIRAGRTVCRRMREVLARYNRMHNQLIEIHVENCYKNSVHASTKK